MPNWGNLYSQSILEEKPSEKTITEDSVVNFLERHDQSEVNILFNGKPVFVTVISASVFFQMARLKFPDDESIKSFDFTKGNHGISLF